jgi:hypothetical protein
MPYGQFAFILVENQGNLLFAAGWGKDALTVVRDISHIVIGICRAMQ